MLPRQQSEVTSFTGQMDEVVPPSHCPGAPAFAGPGGTVQYPKPSAAPVSLLQLKYDSKGPGPCQIDENDPGAGLAAEGRATGGRSLTTTWTIYAPPLRRASGALFRCDLGGGAGEPVTSSALEFWLSFQNWILPQTLGFQLGRAVLKVGAVQPTTLH